MTALVVADRTDGTALARWALAAAAAVAAHSALMAAYLLAPPPRPEGAAMAPAVIVELSPLPVAPSSAVDLAPGPEMMEAQSVPEPPLAAVERPAVEPLPKVETPAAVTLPLPAPQPAEPRLQSIEKPVRPPEPQRVERSAPAPQTSAPQRTENRPAPVARAPSPGSAAARAALANWRDLVVARLQRAKRYPADARNAQGVATVSFTVDRSGRVTARGLARSSGHSALDREALAMVDRAQPLPAFPAAMTQPRISLTVPVRFSVR